MGELVPAAATAAGEAGKAGRQGGWAAITCNIFTRPAVPPSHHRRPGTGNKSTRDADNTYLISNLLGKSRERPRRLRIGLSLGRTLMCVSKGRGVEEERRRSGGGALAERQWVVKILIWQNVTVKVTIRQAASGM